MPERKNKIPTLSLKTRKKLEDWFEENHSKSTGFLLKIGKGKYKDKTVTYAEALEVALCFGWIDSQKLPFDEIYWIQKFTPRNKTSIWSKINREKAEKLIQEGKMKPAGISAIESAKKSGSWQRAYESQSRITIPPDLHVELDKDGKAKIFFESLNSVNRYAILFRIHSAKKEETRKARIKKFMAMLHKGEKIHNNS